MVHLFHKFYACFYLSIPLVMVWLGNGLLNISLQKWLTLSDMKCVPASDTIVLESPNYVNTILATLIRLSAERLSVFLITGNLL